jgi:GTP-binding protein
LTSAKPKIADYPFTTLKPNLGIVAYRDFQSFVIADIPGIIEGAAEGKGLGHYFLRHIERNSTLLFLVPVDTPDIKAEYDILVNELTQYNPEMLDKERLLVISKIDMLDEELKAELKAELDVAFKDVPYLFISSVAQQGLTELKDKLWNMLNN